MWALFEDRFDNDDNAFNVYVDICSHENIPYDYVISENSVADSKELIIMWLAILYTSPLFNDFVSFPIFGARLTIIIIIICIMEFFVLVFASVHHLMNSLLYALCVCVHDMWMVIDYRTAHWRYFQVTCCDDYVTPGQKKIIMWLQVFNWISVLKAMTMHDVGANESGRNKCWKACQKSAYKSRVDVIHQPSTHFQFHTDTLPTNYARPIWPTDYNGSFSFQWNVQLIFSFIVVGISSTLICKQYEWKLLLFSSKEMCGVFDFTKIVVKCCCSQPLPRHTINQQFSL